MRNILLAIILLGLLVVTSCGKTESTKPVANTQPAVTANGVLPHTITDAEVGQKAVCPVMGAEVTVSKNTLCAEYKGKVYYFCCGGCPEKFKQNPDKYAK